MTAPHQCANSFCEAIDMSNKQDGPHLSWFQTSNPPKPSLEQLDQDLSLFGVEL